MDELFDLSKLLRPVYWLLKFCLHLIWDVGVELIAWSVGWGFLRLISFGRYPSCDWSDQAKVPVSQAIYIELLGSVVLLLLLFACAHVLGYELF